MLSNTAQMGVYAPRSFERRNDMDKERKAVEDVLAMLELDRLIREKEIALPKEKPIELLLKDVSIVTKRGRVDGRVLAGKKRKKKNLSRKLKAQRQQRWRRSWKERSLAKALEGNHYTYYEKRWREKKRPFKFSEEEWNEHVQPLIPAGEALELRRYEPGKPTTLDNLIVYNAMTGDVIFEGKEWKLRQLGAAL